MAVVRIFEKRRNGFDHGVCAASPSIFPGMLPGTFHYLALSAGGASPWKSWSAGRTTTEARGAGAWMARGNLPADLRYQRTRTAAFAGRVGNGSQPSSDSRKGPDTTARWDPIDVEYAIGNRRFGCVVSGQVQRVRCIGGATTPSTSAVISSQPSIGTALGPRHHCGDRRCHLVHHAGRLAQRLSRCDRISGR